MTRHRRFSFAGWPGVSVLVLLCALVPVMSVAAAKSGVVTIRATVGSTLTVTPAGSVTLITTLQNGPNKKEWYYVYAINGPNPVTRGQITVRSNRPWSGTLKAVQTAGDKKKMDLASGVLRYSTTIPTTFAQANAAPVLGASPITLASNHASGITIFTHYLLLRVSQGSGGTLFGATLTYSAGQVAPVVSASTQVTISFPGL